MVKEYDDGIINSHNDKGNSSEGGNQENMGIENNSRDLHDINVSNSDSSQGPKQVVVESDYNKIPSNRHSFSGINLSSSILF